MTIRLCEDKETFCFGTNNKACCEQKQGVYLDSSGKQQATNPNATSTSSTSSTTSTSTSAGSSSTTSNVSSTSASAAGSPSTSTPAAASSSGLSTGAKAGIGVGIALAVLAAIGVGAFYLMRKRKNKRAVAGPVSSSYQPEMGTQQPKYEMGDNTNRESMHKYTYSPNGHQSISSRAELDGMSPGVHAIR